MKRTKLAMLLLVAMLAAGQMSMTALAHGSCHSSKNSSTTYVQCNVKSCTSTKVHSHGGKKCLPHTSADGHSYHKSSTKSTSHKKSHH